jgi:hypothetical protein
VLDQARSRALEQSQALWLPGLRTRFRLEEREAEAATLDDAVLILTLKDGHEVIAAPSDGPQETRFRIFWGEGREFTFAIPAGISASDVAASRLVLTGYYQRYSSFPNLLHDASLIVPTR